MGAEDLRPRGLHRSDSDLERPAFLGRSFGEAEPYKPGALRGAGGIVLVAILLLASASSEARAGDYLAAVILGILSLTAALVAFLLFRALLPADLNRDPREHLADFYRLRC